MDKLEGISREMETDGNSAVASFQKDCPDTEDDNHQASDTSDLKQGFVKPITFFLTEHRSVYIFFKFIECSHF